MPKDVLYTSKEADDDGLYSYSTEEDDVWGDLFTRQMQSLSGRAAPAFFEGVKALHLDPSRVPQVKQLTERLQGLTDAGAFGVPAIIPPKQFFTLLSERKFPVATFLRRREHMDYIEEPDLFHEVFGHLPMMTQPEFVDFIESFGKTALAMPKGCNWHMFRLFWFTVEFGMLRTPDGLRAFGAGIVSSPAELENAFSASVKLREFDLREVLRTPYRIDIVQPLYFVIDSFNQLSKCLDADIPKLVAEAQELGDFTPLYDA